jgi:membrane protein
VFDIIKSTVREFLDDDAPRLAAALSYYTVFSLPPILILILLMTGVFMDIDTVADQIVDRAEGALGTDGAQQIETMIRGTADFDGGTLATILSLLAIAFGATGAFFQLQAALNKAWGVAPDPDAGIKTFLAKRAVSFAMIVGAALLLLVTLVISAVLSRAGDEVAALLPDFMSGPMLVALDLGISLAVITLLFAAIFKVLPDATVRWRDVGVGAFVTAILFIALRHLFGVFLSLSDPGSAYGAAGSLAVILIWIYASAMILLLGAEFTQVWARRRGVRIEPSPGAVRVTREVH